LRCWCICCSWFDFQFLVLSLSSTGRNHYMIIQLTSVMCKWPSASHIIGLMQISFLQEHQVFSSSELNFILSDCSLACFLVPCVCLRLLVPNHV
jgi:hypothetical protein